MTTSPATVPRDNDCGLVHQGPRVANALRRVPPLATDAAIVAMLIVLGLLQQNIPVRGSDTFAHQVAHGAVIGGAILPLLARRRFPILTLAVMAMILGVAGSIGPPLYLNPSLGAYVALLVGTFGAAAAARPRVAWVALALPLASATLVLRPWVLPVAAWLPQYPPIIVAFVAGRAERERRELTAALQGSPGRHRSPSGAIASARPTGSQDQPGPGPS
jgi:hypothetical protein